MAVRPAVLVIDDDPDMRRVLKDFLVRGGYDVVEAPTGYAAIQLIESERVDAVILDKEMPGMNGLDVLSFLGERSPEIPVIFITAFGGADIAEEARRRGACHYLEKPFRVTAVVEAVQALLDKSTS